MLLLALALVFCVGTGLSNASILTLKITNMTIKQVDYEPYLRPGAYRSKYNHTEKYVFCGTFPPRMVHTKAN